MNLFEALWARLWARRRRRLMLLKRALETEKQIQHHVGLTLSQRERERARGERSYFTTRERPRF